MDDEKKEPIRPSDGTDLTEGKKSDEDTDTEE